MANKTQLVSHSFTVGTVTSKTRNIDCSLNVFKRKEQVFYSSTLNSDAASIAFLSNDPLTSDNNISITDRSTTLAGNREQEIDYTSLENVISFTLSTDTFVVTDIYVSETNTTSPEPLFYKHVLSTDLLPRVNADDEDYTLNAAYTLISAEILDSSFEAIGLEQKLIDKSIGVVYSNLQTEYSSSTDYTVYYVRYTFKVGSEIKTYTELLDNTPVYRLATVDDLTPLLTLDPDKKVYLIEDLGTTFRVTLPTWNDYSYKPLTRGRITILPPVSSNSIEAWFARVSNGQFFQQLNSVLFKYYIAEFLDQTWDPIVPIKKVEDETSTILSKTLVKLDRKNIYQDDDYELYINLQVNKADGTGVAAYTTNTSNVGTVATNGITLVKWTAGNRTGIKSVDHDTGIVDIEGLTLKSTWEVKADYYFEETNYEFTLYDFNPTKNSSALTHKLVLFVDPETGVEKDQTLYYLKVDESDKVVESNWANFSNVSGVYTDELPLYYETYPSYLADTTHHVFVDEFSVEGWTIESGINTTNFLILGDVTTAEAQSFNDTTFIDARERGGGIKASLVEELVATEGSEELQWHWDEGYWDGLPYPGNASFLLEVPVDILNDVDTGIFSQGQIRDIVTRHTAAGVYPVIRAYGVDVQITGIAPTTSGFTLSWYSDGFGY